MDELRIGAIRAAFPAAGRIVLSGHVTPSTWRLPMRRRVILVALVLAGGAGLAVPRTPLADPLDGKTFRSVDKLPGGKRDGTVTQIHWEVRFKDKSVPRRHSDQASTGTYTFDAKAGTVTVKKDLLDASFDVKTGTLAPAEALRRLIGPADGLVVPDDYGLDAEPKRSK